MSIINSFFIALSMYSRIPVPRVDWEKENMRYAMCFFPMIGVVIGAVAAVAGIAYAVYCFLTPDYLEDFEEDFEDDFDDDFFNEEDQV